VFAQDQRTKPFTANSLKVGISRRAARERDTHRGAGPKKSLMHRRETERRSRYVWARQSARALRQNAVAFAVSLTGNGKAEMSARNYFGILAVKEVEEFHEWAKAEADRRDGTPADARSTCIKGVPRNWSSVVWTPLITARR